MAKRINQILESKEDWSIQWYDFDNKSLHFYVTNSGVIDVDIKTGLYSLERWTGDRAKALSLVQVLIEHKVVGGRR